MQQSKEEVIVTIIAIIGVLLFLGILFLVMLLYYNNKKMQMTQATLQMKNDFDQQLLRSRLEIQDEIFNTISQEIHDNVGQTLSLAKIQVSIIDQQKIPDKKMLQEVKDSIGRAMTDLRDIAKSLSGERIQLLGLSDCVAEELERLKKTGTINTSLTIIDSDQKPGYQQKLILFRVLQELIQNILKHANASEVTVQIDYNDPLKIVIQDNGIGFDVPTIQEGKQGLGLQHIKKRVALLNGSIQINSIINNGTHITLIIPYA
ncbi:MAG: hypothetical protein J7623_13130 [Chitinophaga sp.]|uniref:sensor histidine kinase n=1 Tax=Chitinophaga sp. TaxID=1869181 RepID=UPI001B27ACD1|nr:ATP-binding protein [Chitinophaga sp.]MBO9729574.1 hypothetical protein [Chitinophaga sp.]